jgi:FkbM family methyltransferase
MRRLFTLIFWFFGFNDPFIGMNKNSKKFSYIKKLKDDSKWTLVDLGSHTGTFADRVNLYLNLTMCIFVDPNEEFNTILRTKYPNAVILNYAVSTELGYSNYVRNTKNPGQNFTTNSEIPAILNKEVDIDKVQKITLEKILKLIDSQQQKIFLKLDIEGNEINVLESLSSVTIETLSVISIEVTPISNSNNFLDRLNVLMPEHFRFFRERRYGWISIDRLNPHWTDKLTLFQNVILVNTNLTEF